MNYILGSGPFDLRSNIEQFNCQSRKSIRGLNERIIVIIIKILKGEKKQKEKNNVAA